MNESNISIRYAKALFMAAGEAMILENVMEDVNIIMAAYSEGRFKEMLESPVVKPSEKKAVVDDLFSNRITDLTLNFFRLLIENKREGYLKDIARNFKSLYKGKKGIKSAEITVARKTDEDYLKRFKEILKKTFNADIELEEKIKPEIIGGFILKVEDEQFDASVSSELARIRKKLMETSEK